MEYNKKFLILFMKEAEERKIFESKSYITQEQFHKLINEFAEKNKNNQEVMEWLFKFEVKILEMVEALKQDYFQLGTIAYSLEKEQEEIEQEKNKK